MPSSSAAVLITGMPGCGKTTIVRKLARDLQPLSFAGFFTAEVRDEAGDRVGFDVESFDGQRGILARANSNVPGPRVGKYSVHLADFERVALAVLKSPSSEVFLIDEIGKMELFSRDFERAIGDLEARRCKIVATVPSRGSFEVVERLKRKPGSRVFNVTKSNREEVYREILEAVNKLVAN